MARRRTLTEEQMAELERLRRAQEAGPEEMAAAGADIAELLRQEGAAARLNERFSGRGITVAAPPPEGMEPSYGLPAMGGKEPALSGVPGMSVGPGGRVRGRAAPYAMPGGAPGSVGPLPGPVGMDMAAPERDLDRIPITGARPMPRGVDPWASTSFQERAMERGVLPDTQANLDALGVGAEDMRRRKVQSRVDQGGMIPATEQAQARDELDAILRGERQETRIQAERQESKAARQAEAADKQAQRQHERDLKKLEAQSAEAVANIQAGKPAVIGNGIAMIKQEDGTWKTIIQDDVKKNMNEGKEFTVGTKTFRMAGDNLLMLDEEGGEVNLVVNPEQMDPFARMHFQNILKELDEDDPAAKGIFNMLEADLQARRGGTVRLGGGDGGRTGGTDDGPLSKYRMD